MSRRSEWVLIVDTIAVLLFALCQVFHESWGVGDAVIAPSDLPRLHSAFGNLARKFFAPTV